MARCYFDLGDSTCGVGADIWDTDRPGISYHPVESHIDLNNVTAYEEHVFPRQRRVAGWMGLIFNR